MRVCDKCRAQKDTEVIEIKGKQYDLCDICCDRLISFIMDIRPFNEWWGKNV